MKYIEDEKSIALMKLNCLWKADSEKTSRFKRIKNNRFVLILYRVVKSISMIFYVGEYGVKKSLLKSYWWLNQNRINDFTLKYRDDFLKEFAPVYSKNIEKKIVIYSAVFGGYDSIKEPLYVNENIDYVIFYGSGNTPR